MTSSGLSLPIGTRVRLSGLRSRPELNDCTGMVCGYEKDRYHVRLDADLLKSRALLPANLQIVFRGEFAPEALHAGPSHPEDEADHSVDEAAPEAGEEAGEEDGLTEVEAAMSDGDEVVEAVGGGWESGRRAMVVALSDSEGDALPDQLPDELEPPPAAAWWAAAAWLRPGRSGDSKESPVELSDDDDGGGGGGGGGGDDGLAADGTAGSAGELGGEAMGCLPGTILVRT